MKQLLFITLLTLCMSCDNGNDARVEAPDCSAVLCAAPHVFINFIDASSGDNSILKQDIQQADITIRNASDQEVTFMVVEENGFLYIDKKKNQDTFKIQIHDDIVAIISFETTLPKTNECCDFGILKNVVIADKAFVVEANTITVSL